MPRDAADLSGVNWTERQSPMHLLTTSESVIGALVQV